MEGIRLEGWKETIFTYCLKSELVQELNTPIRNRLSKEALAFIIDDIGDEILSCLSTEDILSHFSVEERIAGLSSEERKQLQQLLEKVNRQPEN